MKRPCIFYQNKGRGLLTDKKNQKLSDIEIAVILERISSTIENIERSQVRIEERFDTLPCEDHTERIVKLEKDRDSHEKRLDDHFDHIEKIYKLTREQGEKISGQGIMSDVLKWLMGIILGAGATALIYFVTRG